MGIYHVVLIKASESKEVTAVATKIDKELQAEGIEVTHIYSFYDNLNDPPLPVGMSGKEIDLAIAIGGDGTVLKAARICASAENKNRIPILPIKVGDFGFISEIQQDEWKESFNLFRDGKMQHIEHRLLSVQVKDKTWHACNDVTIFSNIYGTIRTLLKCNGDFLTRYRSDGLIIATPIGSTAHSLSAGGPILMPGMKSMMVTPIAPFTLSHRSLVLPMDYTIDIELETNQRRDAFLIVDGRVMLGLRGSAQVKIKDAGINADIIRSHKRTYFEVLRSKLKWAGALH